MKLDFSTAYHPQSDAKTERVIKVLEDLLRAYAMTFGKDWESNLPHAEFSYNNSYQATTKIPPFKAFLWNKMSDPTDVV
jgi:hypothetical protein